MDVSEGVYRLNRFYVDDYGSIWFKDNPKKDEPGIWLMGLDLKDQDTWSDINHSLLKLMIDAANLLLHMTEEIGEIEHPLSSPERISATQESIEALRKGGLALLLEIAQYATTGELSWGVGTSSGRKVPLALDKAEKLLAALKKKEEAAP